METIKVSLISNYVSNLFESLMGIVFNTDPILVFIFSCQSWPSFSFLRYMLPVYTKPQILAWNFKTLKPSGYYIFHQLWRKYLWI